MISTSAVFYYFADHLGTSRVMVQASQTTACYEADYTPYGKERVITDTCPQNYKFTGKERDSESSLDYFGARYYAATTGRFLSIDPTMESVVLRMPQTWNRYSYVLNNPLTMIDPDGELWVASGNKNDPYTWVDQCGKGQTCYESVAANVNGDVKVYGSKDAKDVTTYQANPDGVVDLRDVAKHHDSSFKVDATGKVPEPYAVADVAVAIYNASKEFVSANPGSQIVVTASVDSQGGQGKRHQFHAPPGSKGAIDFRYLDASGKAIRHPQAALQADAALNRDWFKALANHGLSHAYSARPHDFGTRTPGPKSPHLDHGHAGFPPSRIKPPVR